MTNLEAFRIAHENYRQFLAADFGFMAGRNKRPDPRFYGLSGTIEKPGNTMMISGFAFHTDDLAPRTASPHAAI